MTMTAREIIQSAIPRVKQKAKYVVIRPTVKGDYFFTSNGIPVLRAAAYSTANPDGSPLTGKRRVHKMLVKGHSADKRLYQGPVVVSCTCEDFLYTFEVALHARGAALILHSNGENPDVRNPARIPSPCGHLYALLTLIVKHKV